jgi:hypothetical protein
MTRVRRFLGREVLVPVWWLIAALLTACLNLAAWVFGQ